MQPVESQPVPRSVGRRSLCMTMRRFRCLSSMSLLSPAHAWSFLLHLIREMARRQPWHIDRELALTGASEPRMCQPLPFADEQHVQKRTHPQRILPVFESLLRRIRNWGDDLLLLALTVVISMSSSTVVASSGFLSPSRNETSRGKRSA